MKISVVFKDGREIKTETGEVSFRDLFKSYLTNGEWIVTENAIIKMEDVQSIKRVQ
ncbi:hypothetical protein V1503_19530 [Bacillus sp. SCS-151]|uniref:hypothetical protein n=1 Tax=Nanhaiella sioensis TaxID=3115293 RepID=UPI00397AD331